LNRLPNSLSTHLAPIIEESVLDHNSNNASTALSEVVAMEAVEGCLEWGLRGVECVAVGGGYFRDGCSRVFFGNVVRLMGTSGEAEAEGAKREP
jgi:hypothetical protein